MYRVRYEMMQQHISIKHTFVHVFYMYLFTKYILPPVGDTSAPKSCVTLMPYTLVTPHYPPICRPILLLPSVLGRILDKKLAGWQGFQLCQSGEKFSVVVC